MNSFQESLEVVSNFIGEYEENTMLDVAMNDLQHLIDIHDIDYVVIAKQSQDLQKLEKALDKACEILNRNGILYLDSKGRYTNKNWKEYLLKEVSND